MDITVKFFPSSNLWKLVTKSLEFFLLVKTVILSNLQVLRFCCEVGYEIAGKKAVEPKDVYLIFSYSGEGLKYKENHTLTFYIDDKPHLSADTVELFSRYYPQKISSEPFKLPKIKYTEFLMLLEGKKVTLQFGETKIDLNTEVITALQDLNKTVE